MNTTDLDVCYCTREDVQEAVSASDSVTTNRRIDRAIRSAARDVEGRLHRTFFPWTGTRYFDWPNSQDRRVGRLWLDDNELVSVATLISGGQTIAPADYYLEPQRYGAPYSSLNLVSSSAATFSAGDTSQRSIAITGVFSGPATEGTAGALAEALDASETQVDVTNSVDIGVGDLIRVDAERMVVVDKVLRNTGVTLNGDLTAAKNAVNLTVSSGTGFLVGETLFVDGEYVFVTAVAGNVLTVKRATNGSVLSAHTGALPIYSARTLVVRRAAAGTAASTHSDGAAIARNVPPPLISSLSLAVAINQVEQESSGYAREVGAGDNQREAVGRGVKQIWDEAYTAYGRQARMRSV